MKEEVEILEKRLKDLQESLKQLQNLSASHKDEQLKIHIEEVRSHIHEVEESISKYKRKGENDINTAKPSEITGRTDKSKNDTDKPGTSGKIDHTAKSKHLTPTPSMTSEIFHKKMKDEGEVLAKRLKDLQENLHKLQKLSESQKDQQLKDHIEQVRNKIQGVEESLSKAKSSNDKETPGPSLTSESKAKTKNDDEKPAPPMSTEKRKPKEEVEILEKRRNDLQDNLQQLLKLSESQKDVKLKDHVDEVRKKIQQVDEAIFKAKSAKSAKDTPESSMTKVDKAQSKKEEDTAIAEDTATIKDTSGLSKSPETSSKKTKDEIELLEIRRNNLQDNLRQLAKLSESQKDVQLKNQVGDLRKQIKQLEEAISKAKSKNDKDLPGPSLSNEAENKEKSKDEVEILEKRHKDLQENLQKMIKLSESHNDVQLKSQVGEVRKQIQQVEEAISKAKSKKDKEILGPSLASEEKPKNKNAEDPTGPPKETENVPKSKNIKETPTPGPPISAPTLEMEGIEILEKRLKDLKDNQRQLLKLSESQKDVQLKSHLGEVQKQIKQLEEAISKAKSKNDKDKLGSSISNGADNKEKSKDEIEILEKRQKDLQENLQKMLKLSESQKDVQLKSHVGEVRKQIQQVEEAISKAKSKRDKEILEYSLAAEGKSKSKNAEDTTGPPRKTEIIPKSKNIKETPTPGPSISAPTLELEDVEILEKRLKDLKDNQRKLEKLSKSQKDEQLKIHIEEVKNHIQQVEEAIAKAKGTTDKGTPSGLTESKSKAQNKNDKGTTSATTVSKAQNKNDEPVPSMTTGNATDKKNEKDASGPSVLTTGITADKKNEKDAPGPSVTTGDTTDSKNDKDAPGPENTTKQPKFTKSKESSGRKSAEKQKFRTKYQEKLEESADFIKNIDTVENKDRILAPAKPVLPPTHKGNIRAVVLTPASSTNLPGKIAQQTETAPSPSPARNSMENKEPPNPPNAAKMPIPKEFGTTRNANTFKYIVLTPKPSFQDISVEVIPPKPHISSSAKLPSTIPPEPTSSSQQPPEPTSSSQQPSEPTSSSLPPEPTSSSQPPKPTSASVPPQPTPSSQPPKLTSRPWAERPPPPKKEPPKKVNPAVQTVILSPTDSLQMKKKRPNSYKTVVLSPKSSTTVRPRRKHSSKDDHLNKELNKIGSKYPANQKPHKNFPVILSPTESKSPEVPPKPKEITVISSRNLLPTIIPNKVSPEPAISEEKVVLIQEDPSELINELNPVQRSELDMAEKILAMIAEGNPKEKFLNQLKAFGIPDQKKLLRYLLEGDLHSFDFGGLMRKYYSYVLRSYTLVNMQDNYREPYTFSTCFAGLDVSKIGSKAEEQEKEMAKKLKQREEKQEDLRLIAVDEDHFKYLKHLADEQPTTIPLTVLKGLVQQAMPVLIDTYRTYARSLGNRHPCTKLACEQYLRMKTRLHLYNTMEKSRDVNTSNSKEKIKLSL